jgi:hypothetical protein
MENKINRVFAFAIIATLTLSTGCGITVTKNYYYTNPSQNLSKPNKKEVQTYQATDTLILNKK